MKKVQQISSFHISWHIAGFFIGLIIGIATSAYIQLAFIASSLWLWAALLLTLLSLSKPQRSFVMLAICAGLTVGLWRGTSAQLALQNYEPFYNSTVTLGGIVNDDVSKSSRGDTRLQLKNVHINGQPLAGKVWISMQTKSSIKRSDTLLVRGKLSTGFGNIPASMSSARLVGRETTSRNDVALRARDWFAAGIHRAVPEPQASLGSGFIVGQHTSLPNTLNNELKIVGLTHAVVASGSNLTILVGFTRRLLLRVSKYTATMFGVLMTAGFIMITGLSPSMARAGLVTALSLGAWYYGRQINPLVLLPIAAGITALANPSYIWGDIGWCLSFGAFAGVLILAPLIQHYFWGADYKPNVMMEILIGTTAAQIATMPVILFSFGTYSSYALIANMLVLPLIPFAMLLTFLAGIAGVVVPSLAGIIGWPATIVMKYMTWVIHKVATLPGAQGVVSYGQIALIATYLVLIVGSIYMYRKTSHRFGSETNILIGEKA